MASFEVYNFLEYHHIYDTQIKQIIDMGATQIPFLQQITKKELENISVINTDLFLKNIMSQPVVHSPLISFEDYKKRKRSIHAGIHGDLGGVDEEIRRSLAEEEIRQSRIEVNTPITRLIIQFKTVLDSDEARNILGGN
jgi:hypothetical protein